MLIMNKAREAMGDIVQNTLSLKRNAYPILHLHYATCLATMALLTKSQCSILFFSLPYSPQPFWDQGPISWKTIFQWAEGVGWGEHAT